ncbi:hypothetical protein N8Y46_25055, partial [Enterobacter hormaechei subsp. steigerwaltii]|nr:hypothetical protein [Enterobacter hormaechei subsp. steigerwaltii]
MVGYHQTNQKTDTGKTLTRWPVLVDHNNRISADKVKELWSDMELIAGATHEHFRIVVPYSARQVSASLSV